MDDAERREQIRRYWEDTGSEDHDASHTIYHDNAILEFPQSGERFEGVANFKEWRWVAEGTITYDGGAPQPVVNVFEFRGDKVARETIYVTEPWDAPE